MAGPVVVGPRVLRWVVVVASALQLTLILVAGATHAEYAGLLVTDLLLTAGLAVGFLWPLASAAAALVLVPVQFMVGGDLGVGVYGAIATPVLLLAVGSWRGFACAAAYLAELAVITSQLVSSSAEFASYLTVWVVWLGLFLAVGEALKQALRFRERERDELLQHQREGIARDLHDTIAHSLSLLVMRAQEERINGHHSEMLEFVIDTSNGAIRDLRAMMATLRGDATGWLNQPQIRTALGDGRRRLEAAGFVVAVDVEGDLSMLSLTIDQTLARVLAEGLANVLRHGEPRTKCSVLISVDQGAARVLISNVPRTRSSVTGSQAQLGLIGMRERVEPLGGRVDAGLRRQGWVTSVTLPLG